ncbi:gp58-like family protein [Massilia sp. GCM10020059]|uniref:Gp58-like family protein n=1 Tax=Massilia agrisoli TaxID=2892444 RepID=A0ABS8IX51_9BURK|nr:gp58-like family protein [Massilia agrisoli]MCC6073086.1 gp58-like family protein [Massilia agrisoli]
MIMTSQFDSLEYAQRLERAGVPGDQAAVHAQVLHEALGQVVWARQLSAAEDGLRLELRQIEERLTNQTMRMRDELSIKIELVRAELSGKIETLRVELEAKIEGIRTELKYMRWLFGVVIALNTAILVKMLSV